MAFRKIRLQSQGLISVAARFFPATGCRVEAMIDPALHHGETGKGQGKVWIELDRLFEKRLSLQRRVAKHVPLAGVTVCLNEE
jgi:hypothetical protein